MGISSTFGAYGVDAEFRTVYPGEYSELEKGVYKAIREVLSGGREELAEKIAAQQNGRKFYAGPERESRRVEFNSAWNPISYHTPGTNDLVAAAAELTPGNRLFTDPAYAAGTGYGALVAAPFAVDMTVGLPYTPKLTDAYVWVPNEGGTSFGGLDHEAVFHRPIYASDTLTSHVTRQDMVDVTPAGGFDSRVFRVIGEGEMYNQNGEKVMSISHTALEVFKVFENPSDVEKFEDKVPTNATVRHLKDWSTVRPAHVYTDDDWETIKEIWRNEHIQGPETLYWEDVKVGDEPAWTCDGPVVSDGQPGGGMPMMNITVRDALLGTLPTGNSPMGMMMWGAPELEKDAHGIYQVKAGSMGGGGPPMGTGAEKHPNQRSVFMNTKGRQYGVRMVTNWMGDDGFLHKFAWRVVNDTDHNKFPESWERPSYLLKVPYLKEQGRFMSTHGYEGDVGITKGYVCDKYERGGKNYVDMVIWSETIEGYIWSECYAVIELPKREDQ
jgi:acyl dehydratase